MGSPSMPPPEVLPPDTGYTPPPPRPPRRRWPAWTSAPATYSLVVINCFVFVVMVLNGVSIG
ncbi:MAG TPA: rhomboid family intramembrane serine protease, partial [Terracidiphilus sp.]|nr:rhomboid family intramembrane serine protease [Terracidiphilus sp.]